MKTIALLAILACFLNGTSPCIADAEELKIFTLNYANAESLREIVEDLKGDGGKVTIDTNTNSLIVIDTPKNLERISKVVDRLDERPQQVEIEVVITDVTDSFLKESGIRSSRVVIPSSEFVSVLSLINEGSETSIHSRTTIRTLSNKPAKIKATTDEVFGQVVVWYGDDLEVIEPIMMPVGDVLEVLPKVNSDGTILVSISPSQSAVSESGGYYEKSAATQVIINDGDTIAIGGLDIDRDARGSRPFFTGRRKEAQRIMIFITARIVD